MTHIERSRPSAARQATAARASQPASTSRRAATSATAVKTPARGAAPASSGRRATPTALPVSNRAKTSSAQPRAAASRDTLQTPARQQDSFRAATGKRQQASDAKAEVVAIRTARVSKKKAVVDEAMIQKLNDRIRTEHSDNAEHRRLLQHATAESHMKPDEHTTVMMKGDTSLRNFVLGMRGKRFSSEEEITSKVAAEIQRVRFREIADPLHFVHAHDSASNVTELALPKGQVELLREHELRTNYDVLRRCQTPEDRNELRRELGLGKRDFSRLVTHADLTRGTDLGGFYADTLRRIGIESIPELALRNPERLRDDIAENLKARGLDGHVPDVERCENWVRYAQHLPRVVQSSSTLGLQLAVTSGLQYWEEQQGSPVRYFPSRERWQEANGPGGSVSGPWMWRQEHDPNSVRFQCGADDLNHVDIEVDRKSGAISVAGEH